MFGTKAARVLAKKYKTMDELMKADEISLSLVDDIGEVTAKSIASFFEQEQTIELIEKLKDANVNMKVQEEEEEDLRFSGMTFVLTGTLEKYTRDEASSIIEKFGGKTSGSVSKKTTYVLARRRSGKQTNKSRGSWSTDYNRK